SKVARRNLVKSVSEPSSAGSPCALTNKAAFASGSALPGIDASSPTVVRIFAGTYPFFRNLTAVCGQNKLNRLHISFQKRPQTIDRRQQYCWANLICRAASRLRDGGVSVGKSAAA